MRAHRGSKPDPADGYTNEHRGTICCRSAHPNALERLVRLGGVAQDVGEREQPALIGRLNEVTEKIGAVKGWF